MAPGDLENMGFGRTDITKNSIIKETEKKEKTGFVAGMSNARTARRMRDKAAAEAANNKSPPPSVPPADQPAK